MTLVNPSDTIVLLARQRSGTNPLRDVLESHPHIFCTPEVFHDTPSSEAELEVETNFFGFLEHHPLGTVRRSMSVGDQRVLFLDFLEFLRCFTTKRYVVIDIKYNSAHHLDGPWRELSAQPDVFRFIKQHGVRVINLRRRNALRAHLSLLKANATDTWTVEGKGTPSSGDPRVRVDTYEMLHVLETSRAEDALIKKSFRDYMLYYAFDYEELFPTLGGPPSVDVLRRLAEWLGVDPSFSQPEPRYRKQSALPLEETIINYNEVVKALEGAGFDEYLEDEVMYGTPLAASEQRPPPT